MDFGMLNVERKPWLAIALLVFHSTFSLQHSTFAAEQAQFQPALPGYEFSFPRDHGTHDDYKTEWWYYTGHLDTEGGKRYGFELTFFRVGVVPPGNDPKTRWDLRNLSLAHFAITDVAANDFRYYEKLNRTSPFTAGAAAGTLDVFNEGWRALTLADGSWRITGYGGEDAIDLVMTSRKAPAIHGENGVSVKAEGAGYASHYYSMTRLEVRGHINGANCHGSAWMDHEFGSSGLRETQQGWDWFSVQLDNDAELMLYQIRRKDGTADPASSGSLISSEGNVIHLRREQISVTATGSWHSKKSGATYPMGWRIAVPSFGIALTLQPLMKNQELVTSSSTRVTYWEGAVDAAGSFGNVAVNGRGYVEMTGYQRAFRSP
jgi:predicted secreted hydrolase